MLKYSYNLGDEFMKNYDVWFTLAHPANFVIEAKSETEAIAIAEDLLADMSQKELLERIVAAIDYMGLKIDYVEEIED